jgi:hypothetical protein
MNREPLLAPKEIAAEFGRSIRWVRAVKRAGLDMPGGLATRSEVRAFLRKVPNPSVVGQRKAY